MGRVMPDIRQALKRLGREPGFAAVAVLTLALGIGANTALFSLVKTVLLDPLPYGDPERLVVIWDTTDPGETTWISVQEIVNYRAGSPSLADVAGYTEINASLTGGQEPERVRAAATTANLFETLDVAPLRGRTFTPAEGAPGGPDVVVLGHGLWQRRFGGSPDVIGQSMLLNGRPHTVIGVMPPAFRLPLDYRAEQPTEAWVPLVTDPANLGQWGNRSYTGIGRLKPGAAAATATEEFKVLRRRWIDAGFIADQGDRSMLRSAIPVPRFVSGSIRGPLFILLGAVAFVLLIACANIVNLLLAKADVRRREIAVRAALGATRRHLVSQLLIESLAISLAGGAVGVALAWLGLDLLTALCPANLPRLADVRIDFAVLAFTAGLSLVTGFLFGLAPALQVSRPDLVGALKDGDRGGTSSRTGVRLRQALVVCQLAVSVVLVVGAGLLLRSLVALNHVDLGLNPRSVLTADIQLPATTYAEPADVVRFYQQLTARLAELPGVEAAGAVRILPLTRTIGDWSIMIEGRPYSREENPNGDFQAVTPGYFQSMQLPLVRGRLLTDADRVDAPLSVVINQTMADRYWTGQEPIGSRFKMGTGDLPWLTIVGIVGTVRHNAVTESPRAEMYLAHAQLPLSLGGATRSLTLVMKTSGDPLASVGALRETVRSLDRNLPVANIRTMDQVTASALAQPRFTATLLALLAGLALSLAAIGIYGTVSLLVTERAYEIGIRMALGARPGSILALVLSDGMALAGVGIALGIAGALALSRLLETLVYGVGTLDPVTFVAAPTILAGASLVACLSPARRAAGLDPIVTLRRG
jgi:putative ABC transport system permease protein